MRLPPLPAVLRADALVCAAFGLVFVTLAEPLAAGLLRGAGGTGAAMLRLLGLAVLAVGVGVWLVARREPVPRRAVLPILGIELAWIGASLALLLEFGPALTPAGTAVVVLGLLAVAAFLVLETLGLREARA